MPPGRRQGAAFVEIVADTDGFEKGLDRSLTKAVKEASKSKNFAPLVTAAGDAGGDAGKEFADKFRRDSAGRLRDSKGRYVTEGRKIGDSLGAGLNDALAGRGFFGRFAIRLAHFFERIGGDSSRKFFKSLGGEFTGGGFLGFFLAPVKIAFKSLGKVAGAFFTEGFSAFAESARGGANIFLSVGRGIAGSFASLAETGPAALAALAVALGAIVVTAPAAIALIFALGGALFSLLGVLNGIPAALSILLAIVAPLVLAFQGFGDVISAIGDRDVKKFNEAIKKLSPSARGVALELRAMAGPLEQLQRSVQESFFSRLGGSLTKLGKALGPTVSGGLQNIAFALGGLVNQLVAFASRPETANILANLLASVARIVTSAGPGIVKFFGAIGRAVDATLPLVEKVFSGFGSGLESFAKFIDEQVSSGAFESFLQSGLSTLGELSSLVGEVLGLFKDMFGPTAESGRSFLSSVTDGIKELREFFQSDDGHQFLADLSSVATGLGKILKNEVFPILRVIIALFAQILGQAKAVYNAIQRILGINSDKPSQQSKGLGTAIADAVLNNLPKFARGGVTSGPSLAGEGGEPEAVIPLGDPVRARQVAQEAGLDRLLGGGGTTIVYVSIDGQQLQGRIDRTVRANNSVMSRQLSNGPRSLAVA